MTTKTDEQQRAAFEAAYAAEFQFAAGRPGKFDLDANDDYEDVQVLVGWRMWQARAALQSQDREDAARIDWMSRQDLDDLCFSIIRDAPHDGEYCVNAGRGPVFGNTFREAIDRARRVEVET